MTSNQRSMFVGIQHIWMATGLGRLTLGHLDWRECGLESKGDCRLTTDFLCCSNLKSSPNIEGEGECSGNQVAENKVSKTKSLSLEIAFN